MLFVSVKSGVYPSIGSMGKDSSSFDEVTRSRAASLGQLRVKKGRSIWSRRTLLLRVKLRRTQHEHMSSGLPLEADVDRCSWHVSNVPKGDMRELRHLILHRLV